MVPLKQSDYELLESFDISEVPDEEIAEFHKELLDALQDRKEQIIYDIKETTKQVRRRTIFKDFAARHLGLFLLFPILFLSCH